MANLELFNPSSLMSQILKVKAEVKANDKDTKKYMTIEQFVKKDKKKAQEIRNNKSQDQKFAHFICDLLRRGQGTIFGEGREESFCQQFRLSKVPDFDVREMKGKLTSNKLIAELGRKCKKKDLNFLLTLVNGYRWGSGVAAFVIIGAKYVIMHEYGGFEKYLKIANSNYKNGFIDDKLLSKKNGGVKYVGVKYIGPKVRDLALSTFLDNYLAVDQRMKAALIRTGMLSYMFKYNIRIESMDDYWGLRSLCMQLAESSRMTPYEFDRTLWHFIGKYCNPKIENDKCNDCEVNLCLSHPKNNNNTFH